MKNSDIEDAKLNNEIDRDSEDTGSEEPTVEELEKELVVRENEINQLSKKLADANERIHDVIVDKKTLQNKINEFELKDIDLEFGKHEDIKIKHNKLQHRMQVTKKQLDDARERVKFLESVISSLENRSVLDRIRRRYPEPYLNYRTNNE